MHEKLRVYLALLVGCIAGTVFLAACGGGEGRTEAIASREATASGRCQHQLKPLAGRLDGLRAHLIAEPGYRQYVGAVRNLRLTYAKTPFAQSDIHCLRGPARTAEKAVNRYVRAANLWTRCQADPRCDLQVAKTAIAREWWAAGLTITKLHRLLSDVDPGYRRSLPWQAYLRS
jgi:hypothetical protein